MQTNEPLNTMAKGTVDEQREIVLKALRHAFHRFPESAAIQQLLNNATVTPDIGIVQGVDLRPPGHAGGKATIVYNPHHIIQLQREHRYPEWVLCASIERLVLSRLSDWRLPEPEVERLVAHRERARRPKPSESGPSDDS